MDFKTASNLSSARSSPSGAHLPDSLNPNNHRGQKVSEDPLSPQARGKARPCRRSPGKALLRARASQPAALLWSPLPWARVSPGQCSGPCPAQWP